MTTSRCLCFHQRQFFLPPSAFSLYIKDIEVYQHPRLNEVYRQLRFIEFQQPKLNASGQSAWYLTVLESHGTINCALYTEVVIIVNSPAVTSVLIREVFAYHMAAAFGAKYLIATRRHNMVANAMSMAADDDALLLPVIMPAESMDFVRNISLSARRKQLAF